MVALLAVSIALAAAEPDAGRQEILKSFREEFVAIAPGQGEFPAEFAMGSADGPPAERPPHRVAIRRPFAIARYEVPQNLWRVVMGQNPSRWKGQRNSVEMLSYDDALDFCRRATDAMRGAGLITPRQVIRLPSEAEWEYAARAGTMTKFSFGDDPKSLADYGWFTGNAAGNDPAVGAKRPNPWKLHDMHGYLWEWCADAWHDSYEGAPTDGSVWPEAASDKRVLRGGSWKDLAERCASSSRRGESRDAKDDAIGLRCVLAEEP